MPASIDDYEIIRELGNGGQGTVRLVKEKGSSADPPKFFACKQIPCTSQLILNNAVSEIKVLLKLNHPHIIGYEDFFITIEEPSPTVNDPKNTRLSSYSLADWQEERPQQQQQQQQQSGGGFTAVVYLLTEYCECGDLSQMIRRTKSDFMEHGRHSIPEGKVLEWIEQCCHALDAVHKLGYTHQDMKTSNCFLTRDGAMKLGDFGLAAPMSSGSSSSNVGTPAYLAPEQLLILQQRQQQQQSSSSSSSSSAAAAAVSVSPTVAAAIDVWGLGSTMLELLTLQDKSINLQVLRDPAQAMERIVADITNLRFSKPLAVLVRDMLQRRPEDRPKPEEILKRVTQIRNGTTTTTNAISASSSNTSSNSNSHRASPPLPLSRGPSPLTTSGGMPPPPPAPPSRVQQQRSNNNTPAVGIPPGTKCALCNVYDAVMVCPSCNDEALCSSCDAMKHRNAQRQGHVRTPVQQATTLLPQQQHQPESGPSSVGSSFDGGIMPQQLPPAPMAAIEFDAIPTATNSGRVLVSARSLTPVDPNSNNINNRAAKPLVAKPKPVFSGGAATVSARGGSSNNNNNNNNNNGDHAAGTGGAGVGASNPVTPTGALCSGSFGRGPSQVVVAGPNSGRQQQQQQSKAMGNHTFPSKPEQQQRPLSPFGNEQRISPSTLASAAGAGGGADHPQLQSSTSSSRFSPMVLAGPPRPELHVPSPQFPTIAAALLKAESGTRIVVNGSGIYSEPLEFSRADVEVVGASSSSSSSATSGDGSSSKKPTIEVRGTNIGAAVKISEVARIKLCNLNIVHAGARTPSQQQQQQQQQPLTSADAAAASSAGSDQKQFAILIADASGAVIENCDISSESGSGIGVAGAQSDPLISGCTISAHLNGVHISAGANGTVYHNVIRGTSLAAILVKRKAQPRLVSNTLENNRQAGIFFFRAGGLTEKNTIVNCGGCAIVVKGGSNPTVRRNRIQHCAQAGILISDESRGTVAENIIQQTRKTGILIKTGASPVVVRNHISRGQEAGIYVFEKGGGRIEDNDVVDNANAGIIVTTGGCPVVVGNRVMRNTFEGIWVCNEGSGRFEKNVLENNGRRGAVDIQAGCRVDWVA